MPSKHAVDATPDVRSHLDETARRLFGQTATVTDIAADPTASRPIALTINYDHTAARALADSQRKRHVEWSLRQTLDPAGDGNALCTWDIPNGTVRWEHHPPDEREDIGEG